MKCALISLLVILTGGCVTPARLGDIGQGADLATTVYGIEHRGHEEQNPAVSDLSTAGLILVKLAGNALLYWMADRWPEGADRIHYIRAGFGFAATAYNLQAYK